MAGLPSRTRGSTGCGRLGATAGAAGCQGAKCVVAINTDQHRRCRPIMKRADYAVIADVSTVIPALIQAMKARHGSS